MADGWLGTPLDLSGKRVWVAGHTGMVGTALMQKLENLHCEILIPPSRIDLREQGAVRKWMQASTPDIVVIAAAKVGGIEANRKSPADFIYDNVMIETNIIHSSHDLGVQKLLFLGSSCIYPKDAPQPITEEALLSGPLEPTNEAYAIAKIAGIKLCQAYRAQHGRDFIAVMPCNLYGPGDLYDKERSHVIPALMLKAHHAKLSQETSWEIWGSGTSLREFLFVEDLAEALVFSLVHYSGMSPLNIGSGMEISIEALARMIADVVGLKAELVFDRSKPEGPARKILDSRRIMEAGWRARTSLEDGLKMTYDDFKCRHAQADRVA